VGNSNSYDNKEFQSWIGWWHKEADLLAGLESLPGGKRASEDYQVNAMAWDLERGMWARWIPTLHTVRKVRVVHWTPIGSEETWDEHDYETLYKPVTDRLAALAILKQAHVEPHWWKSAKAEDEPLMAWAAKYKVKPWALGESVPPTVTEA
jgi:hypothetical protein